MYWLEPNSDSFCLLLKPAKTSVNHILFPNDNFIVGRAIFEESSQTTARPEEVYGLASNSASVQRLSLDRLDKKSECTVK